LGSIGAGLGLGVLGGGLSYGRSTMEDPDSSMGKGLGIASAAATGAGMGMMLGPWGALAGGLIGAGYGAYSEFSEPKQEGVSVNDAVVKFNPQDKFATMKDGIVASTSKGKIDDIVGGGGKSAQKITFGDININGSIKLEISGSGGNTPSRDIEMKLNKDPHFIREITKLIQEQLRSNLAGGKLSPNPI